MKQKTLIIQEYELPILLEKDADGFIATCPAWEDCYAQGNTIEEAITEISLVATSLIQLYQEENIKIPLKLKKSANKLSNKIMLNFPLIISDK